MMCFVTLCYVFLVLHCVIIVRKLFTRIDLLQVVHKTNSWYLIQVHWKKYTCFTNQALHLKDEIEMTYEVTNVQK